MRITILADRLITAEVWLEHLGIEMPDRRFETAVYDTAWPDVPFVGNAEIAEFLGSEEEIAGLVGSAEVILTHHGPVSRRILEAAPLLKAVGCCRTGPVNVNVVEAARRGIPVLFSPGHNSPAVAEFTVGMMLALIKRISLAHRCLRDGVWRGDFYRYDVCNLNLSQMAVGLIGFGAIGKLVFDLLKGFGCRLLVYDPFVQKSGATDGRNAQFVSMEELLAQADIVSLHARVTAETKGMMGAAQFARMRKGSFLVNTARGPLVDYKALYDALASGHLGGAALDCHEKEPVEAGDRLLALDNVLATPHIAGASRLTAHRAAGTVVQDLKRLLDGEAVLYRAGPK